MPTYATWLDIQLARSRTPRSAQKIPHLQHNMFDPGIETLIKYRTAWGGGREEKKKRFFFFFQMLHPSEVLNRHNGNGQREEGRKKGKKGEKKVLERMD